MATESKVDERSFYVGDPTRDGNCGMIALGVLYSISQKVAKPTDRISAALKWNGAEANRRGSEFRKQLMQFALQKLQACQEAQAVVAYIDAQNLTLDDDVKLMYPPAVTAAITSPDGSQSWVDWFKLNALEGGSVEMGDVEPTDYIYNVLGKPHRMINQVEVTLAAAMLGTQIKVFQLADDSNSIKAMLTAGEQSDGIDGGFRVLRLLYEGSHNAGHYYGMMTSKEIDLFATSVLSVPDKAIARSMIVQELTDLGTVVDRIRTHVPRGADGKVDHSASGKPWFA